MTFSVSLNLDYLFGYGSAERKSTGEKDLRLFPSFTFTGKGALARSGCVTTIIADDMLHAASRPALGPHTVAPRVGRDRPASASLRRANQTDAPAHHRSRRSVQQSMIARASSDGPSGGAGASADDDDSVSSTGKALQSVNVAGMSLFGGMVFGAGRDLAVPHLECQNINNVDFTALHAAGFKAVVFDKDNTLTRPYEKTVWRDVADALEQCKRVFGTDNVVVLSNSAGLYQFDPEGKIADEMEIGLGIQFLRHASKKPAGNCEALVTRFGCESHEMIFVGDRYLTDVVYGNRHGMFTVRVEPFTEEGESASIALAKKIEGGALALWKKKPEKERFDRTPGYKPHPLIPPGKMASDFLTKSR